MFNDLINMNRNEEEILIMETINQYISLKGKTKELIMTCHRYNEKNNISINIELAKFKKLKSKLSLFNLGRQINNSVNGGFGGDITNPCVIPAIIKYLQENNDIQYFDAICDIGCSSARIGVALKAFFPFNGFIGIENNLDMAQIALDNMEKIDSNNFIHWGNVSNLFYDNYIDPNQFQYLNNISIIYSFNDANLGMDIGIYLSMLKKNVKFIMITSFLKSVLLYDKQLYEEIKNILGDYYLYTNIKLSGQAKKFKLMIFKITDEMKKKLMIKFKVEKTNDAYLKTKGIHLIIKRK